MIATRPAGMAPASAMPAHPAVVLAWDTGERTAVYGRTVFGRDPERGAGADAVTVRDETLSLSKTHFEAGADAAGPWVLDRHSRNGVVLVRAERRARLVPGERTTVREGDRLEFGDRSAVVERPA